MSLTYLGYRVKIGNTIISNDLIKKGSYSFVKSKRMAADWEDAVKTEHQNMMTKRKVKISFSIRERGLTEQDTIKDIFQSEEGLSVTYWDDYDCEYKTGTFYMEAPEIQHLNTANGDGIMYAATPIKLTEY